MGELLEARAICICVYVCILLATAKTSFYSGKCIMYTFPCAPFFLKVHTGTAKSIHQNNQIAELQLDGVVGRGALKKL